MNKRVVVTGLGVVSPNGTDVPAFLEAIRSGKSGLQFVPQYRELNFNCQVSGIPQFEFNDLKNYLPETVLYGLKSRGVGYGVKAAAEAWVNAGNQIETGEPLWDTGCVFGNSVGDSELIKTVITKVDRHEARKIGSRMVEQIMLSGVSAYIEGMLGLGNKVITNSAACATGTQAILMGYEYIKYGMTKRMIVGSSEHVDQYIFGSFDAMRILPRKFNDEPYKASRPMSTSASGFVPSSGAAALVLEDLDFALSRNAMIYAEVLGGFSNSGGQKCGGSMTSPNSKGVMKCILEALTVSDVQASAIDLISGHLTATHADLTEIQNWSEVLQRKGQNFPKINSLKSMIGHCLSAAGSIESIAVILQIFHQFIHPNINLEDPNPAITNIIDKVCLPVECEDAGVNVVAKANFGFGDVNSCLIFSKFKI
ncbi:MAG TPA: beta-ketoacyl-[acyl-carrier-protein] synthase family protein [Chitinophagaceae bacterium]|jgi:3-oxoacyl-(acyl-carrier-protein) synthase